MTNTTHTIDGQMGTLRYIADSPPEAHGGFAEQTVAAARWALAEIERLSTDNCAHGYALHALKRRIGMGLDDQSGDYSEIAVKVKALQAEVERLIDEIKVLRVDNVMMRTRLERLDEKVMKEYKETCVHHTDRERNNAGCPVCAKAGVERLKAAFGPTIELLESSERFFSGRVFLKAAPIVGATAINSELARLRAIVEKGTE